MVIIMSKEPLPGISSSNCKYDFSSMKAGECYKFPVPDSRDINWLQRMLCRCFNAYIKRNQPTWKYATRRVMYKGKAYVGVWRTE